MVSRIRKSAMLPQSASSEEAKRKKSLLVLILSYTWIALYASCSKHFVLPFLQLLEKLIFGTRTQTHSSMSLKLQEHIFQMRTGERPSAFPYPYPRKNGFLLPRIE